MIAPEFRTCEPTNINNKAKVFIESNYGTDLYTSVSPSLQQVDEIKLQLIHAPSFRCDPEQLKKYLGLYA